MALPVLLEEERGKFKFLLWAIYIITGCAVDVPKVSKLKMFTAKESKGIEHILFYLFHISLIVRIHFSCISVAMTCVCGIRRGSRTEMTTPNEVR